MSAAVVVGLRMNRSCCATRLCRGDQNPAGVVFMLRAKGRSEGRLMIFAVHYGKRSCRRPVANCLDVANVPNYRRYLVCAMMNL